MQARIALVVQVETNFDIHTNLLRRLLCFLHTHSLEHIQDGLIVSTTARYISSAPVLDTKYCCRSWKAISNEGEELCVGMICPLNVEWEL